MLAITRYREHTTCPIGHLCPTGNHEVVQNTRGDNESLMWGGGVCVCVCVNDDVIRTSRVVTQ